MSGFGWRATILTALTAAALSLTAQESPVPPSPAASFGFADSGHETLEYQIEWRLISAGTAKMTWTALPRPSVTTNELRLHLESSGLVSRLFRVDDDYTAALNQNFCALNSFTAAREGNRNKETRVTFDQQARKAFYTEKDLVKNSTITHDVETPACVHDVIGGLLVLRSLHLEPGKTAQIPISDGKKFAQVRIESQRREDLQTALGPRKTIRYEVFLFDNVLFKRSGHLHVWLTDDNARLPVQLQVRLQFTIGTITFKLQKEEKS